MVLAGLFCQDLLHSCKHILNKHDVRWVVWDDLGLLTFSFARNPEVNFQVWTLAWWWSSVNPSSFSSFKAFFIRMETYLTQDQNLFVLKVWADPLARRHPKRECGQGAKLSWLLYLGSNLFDPWSSHPFPHDVGLVWETVSSAKRKLSLAAQRALLPKSASPISVPPSEKASLVAHNLGCTATQKSFSWEQTASLHFHFNRG